MSNPQHKKIAWRCPSNIAIVKYWGKRGHQLPCNASVSMTLSQAITEVELTISEKDINEAVALSYFFEGIKNESFQLRIEKYLQANPEFFTLLKDFSLRIDSHNSFPHSTGIASSASAFGAIALALLDASAENGFLPGDPAFIQKASEMARLGSGSACRSMYEGFAMWGHHPQVEDSSDQYAIPVKTVHENFKKMQDAILIVDDQPKKVSSSLGHSLMNNHVYAENRFLQAQKHTWELINTLSSGDYEKFIKIAESEALALHAMMMTSENYYLLMKPGTIRAIDKIIHFRENTHTPVCFTLDAGPNVHVIYPESSKEVMEDFIKNELKPDLKEVIYDRTGTGPEKIY